MATTQAGKEFVQKALHPSDASLKATNVPGGNIPVVSMSMDHVVDLPSGYTSFVMNQVANPVCPFAGRCTSQDGSVLYRLLNPSFGGSLETLGTTKYDEVSRAFATVVQAYRVTSQSMTLEVITPMTASQGTITVGQFRMVSQTVPLLTDEPLNEGGGIVKGRLAAPLPGIRYYGELENVLPPPIQSVISLGSSAYTARAVEGAYVPLKLDSFGWVSTVNSNFLAEAVADVPVHPAACPNFPSYTGFPYHLPSEALRTNPLYSIETSSQVASVLYLNAISNEAAVRVRVRQTIECIVYPGTTLSSHSQLPPPPDAHALAMYYEVSSRMADAYPASMNHGGGLLKIVKDVGAKVLKYVDPALSVLSAVPGTVGTVAKGAKGILGAAGSGRISDADIDRVYERLVQRHPELVSSAAARKKTIGPKVRTALRKK